MWQSFTKLQKFLESYILHQLKFLPAILSAPDEKSVAFILSGLLTLATAGNQSCKMQNLKMINFLDITYLKSGTERQQKAYQVLTTNGILEKLKSYTPILVGTIPINIDIETSDLDIVCYVQNKEEFKNALKTYFGNENDFIISENLMLNSIKANFFVDDFEIEIFGQNLPSQEQNGFRHMLIEHHVLMEKGEAFRQEIVALKKQGYKTEPAFAKLLDLTGNAYEALLNLW